MLMRWCQLFTGKADPFFGALAEDDEIAVRTHFCNRCIFGVAKCELVDESCALSL